MDLKEITDLISIRKYIAISTSNPSIDRATVSLLNGMLILIDNKIINILKSNEFKDYIDYKDVKKAIEDVVKLTNIKSGFIKK